MTEKIPKFFIVGMCLWYLATGMEYGFILPTINDYIKSTGAPANTIGLALTFFALSGLLSSPVIGWLTDRQKSLKVSFVFSLLCSIIGYAAYTFFQSASMILVGRLISGIGWGVDGAIIGRVSLATGKNSGTFIGVCLLCRQVGIIFAGVLNFAWISNWGVFLIFGFEINPFNSAGFVCIIIYLVFGAVSVLSLKDEPKGSNDDVSEASVMLEENLTEKQYKYKQVAKLPLISEQLVICLTGSVAVYVFQSIIESIATLISRYYLGWGSAENAILFAGIGVLAVIGYALTVIVQLFFTPRLTLLIGVAIQLVCLICFSFVLPFANFRDSWLIPSMGFLTVFFITMIPFMIVSSASILSDFSVESNKSMIQGIRISFERLAQLLGPLWGANMLHSPALIFIFPAILLLINLIMIILSWKWLDGSQFQLDDKLNRPTNTN